MEQILAEYFTEFTYAGLFLILFLCGLGLPIPEEATLLAAGFAVHGRYMRLWPAIIISVVAIVVGDVVMFLIGRRWGEAVFRFRVFQRVLTPARLETAQKEFAQHGYKVVFFARFLAGIRVCAFFTAGTLRLPLWEFVAIDLFAALLSAPISVYVPYVLGDEIERAIRLIRNVNIAVLLLALVAVAVFVACMLVSRKAVRRTP